MVTDTTAVGQSKTTPLAQEGTNDRGSHRGGGNDQGRHSPRFPKIPFSQATAAACNCDNEALQFGNKDSDAASAASVRPRVGGEVIRCLSRYAKHAGNSTKRFAGSAC
jgi:hypothetical protein